MKNIGRTVISLICLLFAFAAAGGLALALTPSTGDKVLDSRLDAVNAYAAKDQGAFVSGLSESYHVDKTKVEEMLNQGMTPADVYMTLRLGKVTGQPVEQVQKAYLNNPGKGWGVIAKSLGIKPGSEGFKSLISGTDAVTGKHKTAAGSKAKDKQSGKHKDKGSSGTGSDNSGGSSHGGGASGGHGESGHGGEGGKEK